MTRIDNETLVRVCRQSRKRGTFDDWEKAEFYAVTKFKHLWDLLNLRHREALDRVKRELERGEVISLLYHGDVAHSVEIETVDIFPGHRKAVVNALTKE